MKKIITITICFSILCSYKIAAQADSSFLKRIGTDTSKIQLNMDAVYNRPFLQAGKIPVAVGGYVESKVEYMQTDGVNEGYNFQMQRMTLFVSSSIHRKIKFLSEIEFEEGTKEINIEFASLDLQFNPLFNLRGGVLMNPIGAFNQNHDGPKWEFNDRPISATQLLPATFSNVGMGFWGKYAKKQWVFAYETYLTNGFDDQIINNTENKTFLAASKTNPDRFEESPNGVPLFTGKIAVKNRKWGEIGLSTMQGIYNKFQEDGLTLDKKRAVKVWAVDFNTTVPKFNTFINGEWAWVSVDVPETFTQQFGKRQQGGFLDIVQPILKRKILGFDNAVLNIACRLEYVDWNVGQFKETGDTIGDALWAIVPAISFRPSAQTVLRFNYRYQAQKDILNNPSALTGGFQFGLASYF
ncbi:MAG: hypothetical protein U5L45_01125 [Saprospiraceae bacterium]|nr:hypothetical protein [Saprospiraceae bacterium]